MFKRRSMLRGGLLGLAGAAAAASQAPVGAAQDNDRFGPEIVRLLREIRDELHLDRTCSTTEGCPELEQIRSLQRTFLRGQGKFPDFIDVGMDVFERVYDWHVLLGQPIRVVNVPDARYAMTFMLTTVVLRHDAASNFIGPPYDRSSRA